MKRYRGSDRPIEGIGTRRAVVLVSTCLISLLLDGEDVLFQGFVVIDASLGF